ncbi:RNA ligase family protein [Nocardiopsis alba]|uniref:RNA ligase family protein n=1 Tax=Nocardiopsis alba TaxID=53437 RepID=UPI003D70BA1F
MPHEFTPWPKTKRLFRDIVVTEKLDGTNAAVHISEDGAEVTAQSRNRIITPEADNYGFASWVHANAGQLVDALGPGLHFGEWWGRGIQRRYGLDVRRFSLFNTERHADTNADVDGVQVGPVPVLYQGPFSETRIRVELAKLRLNGSVAAPGFMDPEGICVFHTQTRSVFKVTLDHNDAGKWEVA